MLKKQTENIIEEFLKGILKRIDIKAIKTWANLILLGRNNLEEITKALEKKEGNLESIQKMLEDLKEDEGQILGDMIGKTISNENNLRDLLNLNQLHQQKILKRLKLTWLSKLLKLHNDSDINLAPYIPHLRPKRYLKLFRSELVIYLPAIYDTKTLKNVKEKWALAFVDIEDNVEYQNEDKIHYTFEFDLLKDGSYNADNALTDFNMEADLRSAEIYSLSEFYVLHSMSSTNTKFFDIWCQNLKLDNDIELEELKKAFRNGKVAGERKKRPIR